VTRVFVDTGPLVALLNKRDRYNGWVRETLDRIEPPVFTCEAVVSEACFLLGRVAGGADAVRALMHKYAGVPMSFADACLVRMTELEPKSTVVTLDGDFAIYRRNKRQVVPTLTPR
jgi:predicted nucleic acid-binding protein